MVAGLCINMNNGNMTQELNPVPDTNKSTNHAQSTMRANFLNGGPGVCVSGLVWTLAALVTHFAGFQTGMITFFIGGMLIVPISSLIERMIKPKELEKPDPKLMREAMMNLPILFGGLFIAYMASKSDVSMFYPVAAVTIGLRYLLFQRLYGLSLFWGLGLTLMTVGAIGLYHGAVTPVAMALCVGVIELLFGVIIWRKRV